MSDLALYNQFKKPALKLKIVKKHANGSLDLADETGRVVVSECPQGKGDGQCSIVEDEAKAEAEAKAKADTKK